MTGNSCGDFDEEKRDREVPARIRGLRILAELMAERHIQEAERKSPRKAEEIQDAALLDYNNKTSPMRNGKASWQRQERIEESCEKEIASKARRRFDVGRKTDDQTGQETDDPGPKD